MRLLSFVSGDEKTARQYLPPDGAHDGDASSGANLTVRFQLPLSAVPSNEQPRRPPK